jgi:hypothetical protein
MCASPVIAQFESVTIFAHLVKNSLLQGEFHLADVVVHIEPEVHEGSTSGPT